MRGPWLRRGDGEPLGRGTPDAPRPTLLASRARRCTGSRGSLGLPAAAPHSSLTEQGSGCRPRAAAADPELQQPRRGRGAEPPTRPSGHRATGTRRGEAPGELGVRPSPAAQRPASSAEPALPTRPVHPSGETFSGSALQTSASAGVPLLAPEGCKARCLSDRSVSSSVKWGARAWLRRAFRNIGVVPGLGSREGGLFLGQACAGAGIEP